MPSALLSDRAGGICLSGSFALGSKITKNVPCTGQKAGAGDCSLEKHGKPKSTQFQVKLRAISGAVNQIRTGDLFLTKEVLYQLSYNSKQILKVETSRKIDSLGETETACGFVELLTRFELVTSSLPRKCSTN